MIHNRTNVKQKEFQTGKEESIQFMTYSRKRSMNPNVPTGFVPKGRTWDTGFLIQSSTTGYFYVWIPVGSLQENGTIDGVRFCHQFGRRNFQNDDFTKHGYHEYSQNFMQQYKSIEKYGGFYLSKYIVSLDLNTGNPTLRRGKKNIIPMINLSFHQAMKIAQNMEKSETVHTHIPYGVEYDSVLEWLLESGIKTPREILEDSSSWGNYKDAEESPQKLKKTGSRENLWSAMGIADLAGNTGEWTQERHGELGIQGVIRGGDCYQRGIDFPVSVRRLHNPRHKNQAIGFRVALWMR